MLSFLYLGHRGVFAFLILPSHSADRMELEILVPRHELSAVGQLRDTLRDNGTKESWARLVPGSAHVIELQSPTASGTF